MEMGFGQPLMPFPLLPTSGVLDDFFGDSFLVASRPTEIVFAHLTFWQGFPFCRPHFTAGNFQLYLVTVPVFYGQH